MEHSYPNPRIGARPVTYILPEESVVSRRQTHLDCLGAGGSYSKTHPYPLPCPMNYLRLFCHAFEIFLQMKIRGKTSQCSLMISAEPLKSNISTYISKDKREFQNKIIS